MVYMVYIEKKSSAHSLKAISKKTKLRAITLLGCDNKSCCDVK